MEQDGISLPVPCVGAAGGEASGGIPAAGTFWQDALIPAGEHSPTARDCADGGGLLSTGKAGKSRPVTVAYVVNGEASQQSNAESMALQCLKDACEAAGSKLDTVNFGKLDFGETAVLDRFYNAGEGIRRSRRRTLTSAAGQSSSSGVLLLSHALRMNFPLEEQMFEERGVCLHLPDDVIKKVMTSSTHPDPGEEMLSSR
ncbi:Mitogen-activated protein kinase kinase kinase 5 [Oryzias melastigma]|uniref:Mitogen-activated protein kinase kinase kinase 5 n=1 Tax=Oryzias melastigma TaxID=30732 RepID=A0A834F0Q9_ORYME|nr:Mitogen-activated protein kinase kinase kinase 5 [Oryzias melastigma]